MTDGFVHNYPAPPIFRYREREWICYHIDMKKRLIAATMCFAVACCTAMGDEPQGETWGRVFGVYSINPSKSSLVPEFPFHTQVQVTSTATSTSSNPLPGGDFSALAPQDLASLPAKAFEYTCYCSEENDTKYQTFTVGNLTPGAGYHLSVYVNEPYQNNTRSQYMEVNGARLKEKDVKVERVRTTSGSSRKTSISAARTRRWRRGSSWSRTSSHSRTDRFRGHSRGRRTRR